MRPSLPLLRIRPPIPDPKVPLYDAQLASQLSQNPSMLSQKVLALYRSIVRTVMRTPKSKARDDAFVYARSEFRRNEGQKDLVKAWYLCMQGELEWKMLRRYFEDMRVFGKANIREGVYSPRKRAKLEDIEEGVKGKVRYTR
jgi:hypothetical protein